MAERPQSGRLGRFRSPPVHSSPFVLLYFDPYGSRCSMTACASFCNSDNKSMQAIWQATHDICPNSYLSSISCKGITPDELIGRVFTYKVQGGVPVCGPTVAVALTRTLHLFSSSPLPAAVILTEGRLTTSAGCGFWKAGSSSRRYLALHGSNPSAEPERYLLEDSEGRHRRSISGACFHLHSGAGWHPHQHRWPWSRVR